MPVILPQIESLLMYRPIGTEVLRLLVHSHLIVIASLSVVSGWLLLAITIITVYLITSNGRAPR